MADLDAHYQNCPGCLCAVTRERDDLLDAIVQWHAEGSKRNINGPDGPTEPWRRAVDRLTTIAKAAGYD